MAKKAKPENQSAESLESLVAIVTNETMPLAERLTAWARLAERGLRMSKPKGKTFSVTPEAWDEVQPLITDALAILHRVVVALGHDDAWVHIGASRTDSGAVVSCHGLPALLGCERHAATRVVKGSYPLPRRAKADTVDARVTPSGWVSPRDAD